MSEMAVVSARKTRLQHRAEDGDAGARAALDLAANPTNFLSTVQVGITLVGVLAGAFGGAGIAEALAVYLRDVRWIGPHAEPVALGLVVAAITYLSLIIGELVPKQIALGNPERVAALVSRPMRAVASLGRPLVALLTGSTNLVFRIFGRRTNVDRSVTEQDVRALLEQGAEVGVVDLVEHTIMENTFRLGDRRVSTIMTPRLDVRWVDVSADPDQHPCRSRRGAVVALHRVRRRHRARRGTGRGGGSSRAVPGRQGARPACGAARAAVRADDACPCCGCWRPSARSRRRAALVLDEFGGVAGVATVDDIIDGLVGELPLRRRFVAAGDRSAARRELADRRRRGRRRRG